MTVSAADLAAALNTEFVIEYRAGGREATFFQLTEFLEREMRRVRPIDCRRPTEPKYPWPGLIHEAIPGRANCTRCRNTGYYVRLGMPIYSSKGLPVLDFGCPDCGRDPIKFTREQVIRKTANLS